MKKLIIKWILFSCVILAICYLPGIKVDNFAFAMLVALVLTVVNIFIKPVVKLITLPLNFVTFGLSGFVINLGFLYAISYFIPQFSLGNLGSAIIASVILSIAYGVIRRV